MPQRSYAKQQPLSKWPLYELVGYGRELGLNVSDDESRKELVDAVRARQELILQLDEGGLRDILAWAGLRCGAGASKEDLVRKIAGVRKMRFSGLSEAGLYALGQLRSVDVSADMGRDEMIRRLKEAESLWQKLMRKKRRLVASWIGKALVGSHAEKEEIETGRREAIEDLKDSLEDTGIVGGLAGKIRLAADDYIAGKLVEIEKRIDQKLDEIDRRMAEWRDREVATRLRIIKITLAASVLVAVLSLGYTVLKGRILSDGAVPQGVAGPSVPPPGNEGKK
jgi:hypothetical protein